jgi:DNA replicative helicase MCM subunit Mcm2 (Cdc46/Mcm family)
MTTNIDEEELFSHIVKLLNKAGLDPRLTPRVLRKKLEERMKVSEGVLKPSRELIKKNILKWYKKNCEEDYKKVVESVQPKKATIVEKEVNIEEKTLSQIGKLAKAVGKSSLFTAVKDADVKTKIKTVSEKLKEAGYIFSSCPTDIEIKSALKKYESQQDLKDIDRSLILSPGKKRSASGISDQPTKKSNNNSTTTTISKKYTDDDEEADF